MKWDEKERYQVLKSGRKIWAYYDSGVGLNDELHVTLRCEHVVDSKGIRSLSPHFSRRPPLTPEERIDIADTMLRRWQRYRREALDEMELAHMSFSGFLEGLIILSKYIDHSDANALGAYERNTLNVGSFMAEEVSREETDELINLGWVVDDDCWTWRM